MKVIKPFGLGLVPRPFEHGRRCRLVVTAVGLFPFDAPDVLLPEVNLWKLAAAELGESGILDEWMLKPRGEVLVTGKAYPPGGTPQAVCAVRLTLGTIDKRLFVVGDRFWKGSKPSDPVPFQEMAVSWANAFGGPGYERNPVGKGYGNARLEDGTSVQLLPNVEDPRSPVVAPGDRPLPAGFEAYDLTWPQRFKKVGTYDSRWLEHDFPGLAADIDWTFFQRAPEDQWLEGHLGGDEHFRIEGMHPEQPTIESRLPAVVARCFVVLAGEGEQLREVPMHIDTVHLFPNRLRGVVLFRGVTDVAEDDAADVAVLVGAAESRGEPKPIEHYRDVVAKRLDRKKGHLYTLRESDLMPPRPKGQPPHPAEAYSDMEALLQHDGALEARLRQRALCEQEQAREAMRARGLDPDQHLPLVDMPKPQEVPPLEELPEFFEAQMAEADKARAESEQRRDEVIAQARAQCAEVGVDFDALLAERRKEAGGPPKFSAKQTLDDLHEQLKLSQNAGVTLPRVEQQLADVDLPRKLAEAEQQLKDVYRRFAHHMPAAEALPGDQALFARVKLQAAVDAGEPLADCDFTGADLSGMDLAGADLRQVFLEKADLTDANLSGADLRGAVLARATLRRTSLAGAKMAGANLGGADLREADLSRADLTRVAFGKARLEDAVLVEATLTKADFWEANLEGVDLARARAEELVFLQADLSDLRAQEANLRKCVFVECALVAADLRGATLTSAALVATRADGLRLDGAEAANLRVVHGSSLERAHFAKAVLTGANFRGTNLEAADFTEAVLDGADLSDCNLQAANLYRVSAKSALLVRADLRGAKLVSANLMMGILQKANIEGADFRGANLFRVDFARIRGNRGTEFEDANMKQIRFVERGEHGSS